MRYKFFTNSERTWHAMFEAISNAEKSIYLEMYIFANDMIQYDFLLLLKEKAKKGLRVRIILDSFGSINLKNEVIARLRESGAEVFFVSYFFHRAHRKILVVDESRAFLGGVNLSQQFRFWNDLVMEIKGGRLVRHIIRSFAKVYNECGGGDPKILSQNQPIILDKTRTWLIEHFPIRKKFNLKKVYKEHLNRAQESIILVTPYFAPQRWLVKALHQAVLRGVKVEALVPKNTFVPVIYHLIDRVNYFYMRKLSRLGVGFFIDPTTNHAKVMIIDGKEGIIGSQNLDFLSFDFNNEVGVFLKNSKAVRKLLAIIKNWKKNTSVFDFKNYKPTWFDYILSPFISLFSRIL